MAKEYLAKLSAFVEDAADDWPGDVELECRHFFSGAALYAAGRICVTLTPVGLAMKLPEETRERLLQGKKAVALRYFPKAPIKKDYVLFPEGVSKRRKTLQKYARESVAYVSTLPTPRKKRK